MVTPLLPIRSGMISSLKRPGRECARTTSLALGLGELGKGNAEHVHLDAGGDERDDRMHVLWDAWRRMQRYRRPHCLDVPLDDAMGPEEGARGIGAVHVETLMRARMLRREAHVVE